MPVSIGYVIDGAMEDHMSANQMIIFFVASVLRFIWWYGFLYTPLRLSERLKFRTMSSHDCLIFSVCFEAMRIAKHSTKIKRSSCVSSVSVTCMRRTCIMLMRIVLEKKNFPKDRNCEICKRTKITRAPCRRRKGEAVLELTTSVT